MQCFVIMPFARAFDDVYDTIKAAASTAVAGETLNCFRLDEVQGAGRISDDLIAAIQHSDLCIADLSGNNPNVLWEVGYAMALSKPIVFISQDLKGLPFDIKDMRVLEYSRDNLARSLREPAATAIRATLAKHSVPRRNTRLRPPRTTGYSIAITGSSNADPQRLERRLPVLLRPHLSSSTTWYCGSSGATDEAVLRFLLAERQKLIVVGYHQYDISRSILQIITQNDLQFLDPHEASLPISKETGSQRNMFFAFRTDLVILFWDGRSRGVGRMIEWFRDNAKDFLLAFV